MIFAVKIKKSFSTIPAKNLYFVSVIEAEKDQLNLISGIENFDTKKLKHTETQEKNPLPTKEGTLLNKI